MPDPGSQLVDSPAEIRLIFDESLSPGSTFELFGQGFRAITGIEPGIDPQAPEQLRADVPDLKPGNYTVQWTVRGADGHPSSGSYAFQVLAVPPSNSIVPTALIVVVALVLSAAVILLSLRLIRQTILCNRS